MDNENSSHNTIRIYATNWCLDCRRAKRFFDQNQISYVWVNIDQDREAEQFVLMTNHGMRSVPTIIFPDGSKLVEPNEAQLRQKMVLENE